MFHILFHSYVNSWVFQPENQVRFNPQSSVGLSGLTSLGNHGGSLLGGDDGDRLRGSENDRDYKARDTQWFQVGLVILIEGLQCVGSILRRKMEYDMNG